MFETLSHFALQQYWWIIISTLGATLVFLMFVQGGQTLINVIGKNDIQRTMIINTLGRKWEFTFTTLVTFGGAFFASFPLFYSTSFGGAYWVWMIILGAFIIQAVSYEFRSKANNFFGAKFYQKCLYINGIIAPFFIGTVVATFFTGSPFSVNMLNHSQWETPWHGLELLLNIQNLILGFTVLFLTRSLGLLYFLNSIDDDEIADKSRKHLIPNSIVFVIFFLTFVIWLLLSDGYAVNPENGMVFMEAHKYLSNFINMPVVLILFLVGVQLVLYGFYTAIIKKSNNGIWFSGSGTFLAVLTLFLVAGFNNTSFYPSYYDLQSSLTIINSSSSHYTLTTMSYVSLLAPGVATYIWFVWKAMNNKKINRDEMSSDDTHIY